MSQDSIAFDGSIPALYDRHLGPLLFELYAKDIARRVADVKPRRVLEIACGSGRVTRQLDAMLAPDAEIVATDLSESMIAYASGAHEMTPRVTWQQADGMALPFDDGAFDVVVCQFGLMFFPDPSVGLHEMARVIAPGGHLLLSTWDSFDANPYARVVHERVAAFFPDRPPQFMHVPFAMNDRAVLHAMAVAAGFADTEILWLPGDSEAPSARDAARGFVRGNPLAVQLTERGANLDTIEAAVTAGLVELGGDTPFRMQMRALLVHGRTTS